MQPALRRLDAPLKRVGESCPINASLATSAPSAPPCPASANAFAGSCQRPAPRSSSVEPMLCAVLITSATGWTKAAIGESPASALARRRRIERHRRRPVGRSVGHRKHHAHERNAVGVAVMDPRDQRAAAVVVLDEMELPHRPCRIERRGDQARHERLQFALARLARQAPSARHGGRGRTARRFPRCRTPAARRRAGESGGTRAKPLLDHLPQARVLDAARRASARR